MRYRKKPVVVEATQWFRNGDHPSDNSVVVDMMEVGCNPFLSEGKVVRRYNHPSIDGEEACPYCDKTMAGHGWIDTLEGGHIVCPGDFIITGIAGEHYPCKPDIFEKTYEKAED